MHAHASRGRWANNENLLRRRCAQEWVEWQQRMKTQGRLGEKRIVLLELAGMEWGIMDNEWEERFDDFVSFRYGVLFACIF